MSKQRVLMVMLVLAVISCLSHGSDANLRAKSAVSARKEDLKFIKCGVCEEISKQLTRQVNIKQQKVAPNKLTELEIISITENICNTKSERADWLMYLDIVEDGDSLKLVEQQEEGECNTECKTIERACQEVMGDHDTDVAEFIFKSGGQRLALLNLLCKDLSKACVGKPPAVPKDREPGEPFTPKLSKDAEMAKLMRSMSDIPGAPGLQMYSREQLLNGRFGMQDDVGDDEDEDEGDNDMEEKLMVPSSKHTIGRQSLRSLFVDQAQLVQLRLESAVRKAVDSAAHHVRKISHQASKWWHGDKDSSRRRLSTAKSRDKPQKAAKSEL